MIVDTIESYLNLDELDSPTSRSEMADRIETAVSEIESRHNQIYERFVSLKAITETLREQILSEKELWEKELKETIELEKQLREHQDCGSGDKFCNLKETDYKKRYDVFKGSNYFTFNLDNYIKTKEYKQTLYDVETKCNMELLKIQHSITILKPLKEMAARWTRRDQPESGDKLRTDEVISRERNTRDEQDSAKGVSDVESLNAAEESEARDTDEENT